MANTENIEAKLCAYIDGDLDAQGRAEIEKHLAANPQHRGLIEQLSKQRDLLRQLPREEAPEDIIEALQSQMERSVLLGDDAAGEPATMKIHRWPQIMAVAAIVMLTIGLGVIIYFVLPRGGGAGDYASVPSRPGATLDGAKSTSSGELSDVAGELGARRDDGERVARTATPAKSAAPEPMFKREESKTAAGAPAVADAVDQKNKENDKDVFAPSLAKGGTVAGAGVSGTAGKSAVATDDLRAVQERLQNADLARQLKDAPGGLNDNAVFVVVDSADPLAARSQVTNYLESKKIAWDDVAHPMPPPFEIAANQSVSLDRSQQVQVRMKTSEKQREAKPAAPSAQDAAAVAPQAQQQQDAAQQQQDAPQQQQRQFTGVADARRAVGKSAPNVASNAIQADEGLTQAEGGQSQQSLQQQPASQQPMQQPMQQQQQLASRSRVPGQGAADGRVIIARGMTKQQAQELSSTLSKQTAVQRAAVYEQRVTPDAQRNSGGFNGPTTRPSATTAPAPLGLELATVPPAAAPAASNDSTSSAYRAITTAPSDILPTTQRVASAAGPSTAPTQEQAPTTSTAPAPIPLAGADASGTLTTITTHPTTAAAVTVDEPVDVVILVQDETVRAPVLEDPQQLAQPNAAAAPAPAPTTAPAPAPPAPATQSAPVTTQPNF